MSSQRTIWKGFCRACLAERRQQQQRRFVHQDVASTSATPLPRNSPKPEDADSDLRNATALAAIRFELGQTKPALPKVWMHLKELAFSDVPPTDLTGEIIRKAEPTLQRISRPKDRLTAPLTIVAYMEEAEALYSRYRFVADRQHPSTPGTSAPMRILEWLKGFGELAYAPAAWRVWEDCRNKADEDGIVLARDISHSVILTTTKWVAFCKQYYRPREERRLLRQKIKEALENATAIMDYLKTHGQTGWLSRSLYLRLIKETGTLHDTEKFFTSSYGLNLEFPSTWQAAFNDTSDPSELANAIDRHAVNTMLSSYSDVDNLSKMISIFENVTHFSLGTRPDSFFSTNSSLYSSTSKSSITNAREQKNFADETEERTDVATVPDGISDAAEKKRSSHYMIRVSVVNTSSYELLISTACRMEQFGVARHYLKEMASAWRQESQRLRRAFQHIADKTPAQISELDDVGKAAMLPAVRKTMLIPSVHGMYTIFSTLKLKCASGNGAFTSGILAMMRLLDEIMEEMQLEVYYWQAIGRKIALLPYDVSTQPKIVDTDQQPDPLKQLRPFIPRRHATLLARAVLEHRELLEVLQPLSLEAKTDRFVATLVGRLKARSRQTTAVKGARITTDAHAYIRVAIRRAERWLLEDVEQDSSRIGSVSEAISTRRKHGYDRTPAPQVVNHAKQRLETRRQKVRDALISAKEYMAKIDATNATENPPPDAIPLKGDMADTVVAGQPEPQSPQSPISSVFSTIRIPAWPQQEVKAAAAASGSGECRSNEASEGNLLLL